MITLPRNKSDFASVTSLENCTIDELLQSSRELLSWLQDGNWPIASKVADIMIKCGVKIEHEIKEILSGEDDIWKYWIISLLLTKNNLDLLRTVCPELRRIAQFPSKGENLEGVDLLAREKLKLSQL